VQNSPDEIVYELVGKFTRDCTKTDEHSVAHIHIAPKKPSVRHLHPKASESYYVLKGEAEMVIDERKFSMKAGDAVLIRPNEVHQNQIFNTSAIEDLEFIAVTAPAWSIDGSVFL
jgi:mannose-6-phosphate isomerase-like protein (cupin superfamily)